jgi:purine-binding chemotaxis protein CheW
MFGAVDMLLNVAQHSTQLEEGDDLDRYVLFSIAGEAFACPILQVRQVIKASSIKEVPFMIPSCAGVINLRGQLIGVIDLRIQLRPLASRQPGGIILIIDLGEALIGAYVDDVRAVIKLRAEDIKTDFSMEPRFHIKHQTGIAMVNQNLVSILDMAKLLHGLDLKSEASEEYLDKQKQLKSRGLA